MRMQSITLSHIEEAAQSIAGGIVATPAVAAPRLAQRLGVASLVLKLESLQYTGSFKDRGALNKLLRLTEAEARRGVIAMSAGNHAQGVAYHAQKLKIPATIVMPEFAPFGKVERTRELGAKVLLHGDGIDSAAIFARELAEKEGLIFVHPYDDPLIIAGQGTIGLELAQAPLPFDCILVPIGGGGLISGIAVALKALRPEVEIVGVEAAMYPSMLSAIRGMNATLGGPTIAEGIAVKSPGAMTKAIIERHVSDILLVSEDRLEEAVHLCAEQEKLVAEGAGAAGIAALLSYPDRFRGRNVATVICGGNIDLRILAQVLMRGLANDGRLATLRVEISDTPGVLGRIAQFLGKAGANIIEIYHRRMFHDLPVKQADLDIIIETRNREHIGVILEGLEGLGFPARVLNDDSHLS